jgi:hypothetical protein
MAQINIDHLIDPKNPKRLKRGVLLTPAELTEVGRRGLERWDGVSMKLVEPAPNPFRASIITQRAPEELKQAVADAEAKHREAQKLRDAAAEKYEAAILAREKFASAFSGTKLTDAGTAKRQQLEATVNIAVKNFDESRAAEEKAHSERSQAQRKLDHWISIERLRMQEELDEKEKAAKIAAGQMKDRSLSGELARLREKLLG